MLGEKFADLRDCELVLHHMKQQVADSAHAVEIGSTDYGFPAPVIVAKYLLPTLPNIVYGGPVAALSNERPCFDDAAPCRPFFVVKADTHMPAWSQ